MKHFLFLAVLMLVGIATALDAQTITTFDLPNSTKTVPRAIDLFGQTAGYYQDATGTYGFLRQRDGTFTSFAADPSNAHSRTFVTDMNSAGQIIGFIEQASGGWTGFLRETDGTIVQFNGTGTISAPSVAIAPEPQPPPCCPDGTSAIAINEFGQITGTYGPGVLFDGFLRQPDGTTIDFYVNLNEQGVPFTIPQAINLPGQITGYYRDSVSNAVFHGFLQQPNGKIITFDPQNSTCTTPQSINLFGQIAGYYQDANLVFHGFLRQKNGRSITFDPTGSIATQAAAINLEGQIAGYYTTADGIYHGFLRTGTHLCTSGPQHRG